MQEPHGLGYGISMVGAMIWLLWMTSAIMRGFRILPDINAVTQEMLVAAAIAGSLLIAGGCVDAWEKSYTKAKNDDQQPTEEGEVK